MSAPAASPPPWTAPQLRAALATPQPRDFLFTALGAVLAVPLSRQVQRHMRFVPLLVLGTVGGLVDFYQTEARNSGLRAELAALEAAATTRQASAAGAAASEA